MSLVADGPLIIVRAAVGRRGRDALYTLGQTGKKLRARESIRATLSSCRPTGMEPPSPRTQRGRLRSPGGTGVEGSRAGALLVGCMRSRSADGGRGLLLRAAQPNSGDHQPGILGADPAGFFSGPVERKSDLEVVGGGLDCGAVKRVLR